MLNQGVGRGFAGMLANAWAERPRSEPEDGARMVQAKGRKKINNLRLPTYLAPFSISERQ